MFKINWKENTRYTIVFDLKPTSTYSNLSIEYTDGTTQNFGQGFTADTWRQMHLITETNKTIKYLRCLYSGGNCYIDLNTFMVLEGVYAVQKIPPYVPYNCIQIKKINANIWDEQIEAGGYNNSTGEKEATANFRNTNYISIKPNTELCLMKPIGIATRVFFYDKSKVFISSPDVIYTNQLVSTFTTPNNAYYMNFKLAVTYGSTYNNDICINISNPSINGTYIAHAEKTYNFPLSEGQKLYEGSYFANDGIHNVRKQYIITGQEDWIVHGTGGHSFRFNKGEITNGGVCSHYTMNFLADIDVKDGIYIVNSRNIIITDFRFSTLEDFTTYLQNQYTIGKPIIVEYNVRTSSTDATLKEYIVPFTPEQQSVIDEIINDGTYKPVTHYTAEASINPDMEIGYYKDLETLLNNLSNS